MAYLENLKKTKSLSDLAILLGYKPASLSYILYKIPDAKKYTIFDIKKKTGGVREIKAPIDRLKRLQKSLAKLLMRCEGEIHKNLNHKTVLAHGFKKKCSIITNAMAHKNRRHVFNVDLKEFFPSINFGRVRGFFIKNAHFQLDEKIATIIAQISCHNNNLPQGSPCSPVISNLIGGLLDVRMVNLAKRSKCTYTRYADDLTFSTNKKDFSPLISEKEKGNHNIWVVSKKLENEIRKVGFVVNKNKISMQFKNSRQITTGLVVNKKVNVKKEYYKKTRSMCHTLFKNGAYYYSAIDPTTGDLSKVAGNYKQLEGYLSFVYQIRLANEVRKDNQHKKKGHVKCVNEFNRISTITRLYKDFLWYKHFFALDMPLIVCEGKTDPVYLKCALISLSSSYPSLIVKTGSKYTYNVKFLHKSKNFLNVCSIGDGSSGLTSIMKSYEDQMKLYAGSGKKHPVIILADDDKGAKSLKDEILKKYKKIELFQKYTDNLYVAFVPKIGAADTAIEDLFEPKILATELDGKKFNRNNKPDHKTEYSKQDFAHKVIKANQRVINFDGFKGVMDLFTQIIDDYASNP